jgi:hypothetical protein
MDYYYKYKKYKTKYQHLGGMINIENDSPIIEIINIILPINEIKYARSLLNNPTEYCGKYIKDKTINIPDCDIPTYTLKNHTDVNKGELINGRNACTTTNKKYYGIIWHTHQDNAKFYPSREDLLTIKKIRLHQNSIRLSILYSSVGIWLIKSNDNEINETQTKKINEINCKLYFFNDNYGMKENFSNEIKKYIKENYIKELAELNYDIEFLDYPDTIDINTIVFNIRLDSLEE